MDGSLINLVNLFAAILTIVIFLVDDTYEITTKKKLALLSFLLATTINIVSSSSGGSPLPPGGGGDGQTLEQERLRIESAFIGTWQDMDNDDIKCTFRLNNIFSSDNMEFDGFKVIRNRGSWYLSLKKNHYTEKEYRIIVEPNNQFELVRNREQRKFKKI